VDPACRRTYAGRGAGALARREGPPPGPLAEPSAVLLLEGPLSPLYRLVARHLEEAGVDVHRINLCPGDRAAWGFGPAVAYRGRRRDWPDFVGRFMDRHGIKAVLMHSERRPYHLEAAQEARCRGVDVLVTELGYLRPDWMTLERNGNSVDSLFPADLETIQAIARVAPAMDDDVLYPRDQGLETIDDLKNSLPNVFLWFFYPHYRAHGLYHPFVAYARFLWREGQKGRRDRAARAVRERLRPPFFLFAMQTDTDFQIRANSQFADMREALTRLFSSFAAHGPREARLLVKKHPGDLGPVDWAREVPRLAEAAGIADRVDFVDGLSMSAWCADAAGLVTVNSSAGLDGLSAGLPVHTLSPAIYDVPGLTFQGALDRFWHEGTPPDPGLVSDFRKALAAAVQVRGTIYSRAGTKAAARHIAERIVRRAVGLPGAVDGPPPRYARARALGIRP
jgi:capsular polysaccharide export protein